MKKVCIRSWPLFASLLCNNFHVAVYPRLNLEGRLVDLGVVPRDDHVRAFREHERGKGAHEFADDVPPWSEHREGRIGESLGPGLVDELERDRRAAMADRDVDQLAGDDLD